MNKFKKCNYIFILLFCIGQYNTAQRSIHAEDASCYAATSKGIIYGSTDGSIWLNNGLVAGEYFSLVKDDNYLITSSNMFGIFRSTNNGQYWYPTDIKTSTQDMAINHSNVYAIIDVNHLANYSSNLLKSTDHGLSWSAIVVDSSYPLANTAMAVYENNIVVGTDFGNVFYTTNSGSNWIKSNPINDTLDLQAVWAIDILENIVMISAIVGGSYLSTDGAKTWKSIGLHYSADTAIETIEIINNENLETQIYLGTWNGILMSSDLGNHWNFIGLENMIIEDIAFSSTHIFASTRGNGIFSSSNKGLTWMIIPYPITNDVSRDQNLSKMGLSQNYPNPFNSFTTIEFYISKMQLVEINVFDLLGRKVTSVIQEVLSPGKHLRQWNAESLPSGVYYYRLSTVDEVQTKRLILVK